MAFVTSAPVVTRAEHQEGSGGRGGVQRASPSPSEPLPAEDQELLSGETLRQLLVLNPVFSDQVSFWGIFKEIMLFVLLETFVEHSMWMIWSIVVLCY